MVELTRKEVDLRPEAGQSPTIDQCEHTLETREVTFSVQMCSELRGSGFKESKGHQIDLTPDEARVIAPLLDFIMWCRAGTGSPVPAP